MKKGLGRRRDRGAVNVVDLQGHGVPWNEEVRYTLQDCVTSLLA